MIDVEKRAAEIQRRGIQIREAADELTKRIEWFAGLLQHSSGNRETAVDIGGGESLLYARSGKEWVLYVKRPPLVKLMDAPLKVKIAAVKAFPALLAGMETEQSAVLENIRQVCAEFDAQFPGAVIHVQNPFLTRTKDTK